MRFWLYKFIALGEEEYHEWIRSILDRQIFSDSPNTSVVYEDIARPDHMRGRQNIKSNAVSCMPGLPHATANAALRLRVLR
jgi:hypothetical protein